MAWGRDIPLVCVCLWFAVAGATAFAATIDFQPLPPLELTRSSPSDHVIGDFNGDGHLDLVVIMSGSDGGDSGISVLLGDGTGGFDDHDVATTAYQTRGVATGDFDGDGALDLALTATLTADGRPSRDVHILLGDGAGGFHEHSTVQALQDAPHAVTVGDFNEDGILDLVIGTTRTTSFHAGVADARFGAGQLLDGSSNLSGDQLFSADLNGDGHLDVVSRQAVYLGAGKGSFTRSAFFAVGAKAVTDLNGDGRADLISAAGSSLQTWYGNGDGSFAVNTSLTVGTDLVHAVAADFDGDGHPDVALASAGDMAVAVLLNDGSGTLSAPIAFATGPQPRLLATADWNEDGFPDMVVPYNNLGDTPYATRLIQTPRAPSPGRLQFSAANYSISEAGPSATVSVSRTGGNRGIVSIDYATSDGSAVAGIDYIASAGRLTFGDGILSQRIAVPILEDTRYEGNEAFELTLNNPRGGVVLGTPAGAVLTIMENDAPPPAGSFSFDNARYLIGEGAGSVNVSVTRSGGSFGAASVDYASADGTATAGRDYSPTTGTLSFADGEITQSFTIAVLDDALYEGDETANLTLGNVTGGASLGMQSTAVLVIAENDPTPPAGNLQFSAAGYHVAEKAGGAFVTVTRSGGSFGTVTVDYATDDLTATRGSDYVASMGTLTFGDGVASVGFIVTVLDDALFEGDETVALLLGNPGGGALIGAQKGAQLTITDDDAPPAGILQFGSGNVSVAEDAGFVSITVTRGGGSFGMVTIGYSSSDGTATAGQDYAAVGGLLAFDEGEISKTLSVPIFDDAVFEGDEQFQLHLDSPTGGAVLGSARHVTLTIGDNDPPLPAASLQPATQR